MKTIVGVKAQTGKDSFEWFGVEVDNDSPSQITRAIERAEAKARAQGKVFVLCDFRVVKTIDSTAKAAAYGTNQFTRRIKMNFDWNKAINQLPDIDIEEILERLGADNFNLVKFAFDGMSIPEIKAELNKMFPNEPEANKELAGGIFKKFIKENNNA